MKYLGIVFLSGFFLGFSGIANASPPTIDDVYQMLLKQQEKIASLEANQRSLERDVTNSKLREARLRDDLHKAETKLSAAKKPTNTDFGEPTFDAPQREEGFVASAGVLHVRPHTSGLQNNDHEFDVGFDMSAGYQDANNVDYAINYKHFEASSESEETTSAVVAGTGLLAGGVGASGDPLATTQSTGTNSYKVKYDVVDLEIGKRLQLADSVSLRVSGGLRYTAIEESSSTSSVNAVTGTGGGGNYDLWGVGIKAGIAPEWNPINSNLRIFSSLSGAYLVGKIDGSGVDGVSPDNTSLFSMVQASVGMGYMLPTGLGDFDVNVRYQYELLGINSAIFPPSGSSAVQTFDYRGYDGVYGSISYAFNSAATHYSHLNLYTSLKTGASIVEDGNIYDTDVTIVSNMGYGLDLGHLVNGAIGLDFKGYRVELEAGNQINDIDTLSATVVATGNHYTVGISGADLSVTTLLANIYKDFYLTDRISSYLTSGVGVAFGEASAKNPSVTYGSATVNFNGVDKAYDDKTFAWQMGVGLGYDLTENVLVDLGYRYLGASDFTFEENTDVQFGSHNVTAGVRYLY